MTSPAHMSGGLVQISGPLFSPFAGQIIDDYMRSNMDFIATLGEDAAIEEMTDVFQNPSPLGSGGYRDHVKAVARSSSGASADVVIHDSGVVYGPWLAGTGSRNATTRFKGYSHWRRTAQRMEELAPQVMVSTLRQLVRKLGG